MTSVAAAERSRAAAGLEIQRLAARPAVAVGGRSETLRTRGPRRGVAEAAAPAWRSSTAPRRTVGSWIEDLAIDSTARAM